jgi:hypothetical protein
MRHAGNRSASMVLWRIALFNERPQPVMLSHLHSEEHSRNHPDEETDTRNAQ